MKPFSQSQGKVPFNWNKFLSKRPSDYTEKERNVAYNKASSWVTCACGNQCSIIPRVEGDDPHPVDSVLAGLGHRFYRDIAYANDYEYGEEDTYKHARETLAKIEKRSAFLIKKEQKKLIQQLLDSGFRGTIK